MYSSYRIKMTEDYLNNYIYYLLKFNFPFSTKKYNKLIEKNLLNLLP